MFNTVSKRFSEMLIMLYGNELAHRAIQVAAKVARVLST
jgi:hypothetical protein